MKGLTFKRLIVAGVFLLLVPSLCLAVPLLINYQGRLTDNAGAPVNGDRPVVFSMYTTATGGGAIWMESRTVTVTDGVFSVELGSVSPIPFMTFQTDSVYLGISVDTDAEMTPRQRLTSVGYAYKAETAFNADMLEGVHAYELAPATHTHSGTDITSAVADAAHADNADMLGGQTAGDIINAASAGGVPSGFMILGNSDTPPPGYTYTGRQMEALDYWTTKASMPTPRYAFAAVAVNGKVYAIGGYNGVYLPNNEEYDPATNTWTTKTSMPTGKDGLAASVANGKVYAIGGYDGINYFATTEEYDPAADSWTTKASMPTARSGLAAVAVNGKVYAIGGYDGIGYLSTTEEYDPATDTWTTKASMPTASTSLSAVALNNKIYAIGGYSITGSIANNQEYDAAANTWTTRVSMSVKRVGLAAAVVNGKIYAIGGNGDAGKFTVNEEYNPAKDTWTTMTPMPTARWFLAAAEVSSKIYVLGGFDGSYFQTNEEYAPPSVYYMHVKD